MAMPVSPVARRYSVEEVLAFPPDGNRYEVVHGELLVTPAPSMRHQGAALELIVRVREYVAALRAPYTVFMGPADYFHHEDVYVQPDALVAPTAQVTGDWRDVRQLSLVIEVVSPSSARGDRLVKRRAYQEAGVETYWVVDTDRRVVEVWHPGDDLPELVTGELTWRPAPEAPVLKINLPELFGKLPGPPSA
jgi:Uma2 family endonuclease